MACTRPPITDAADCGFLCLCVCKCINANKPKCPNMHVYNLNIALSSGLTVTDAGGSMSEILLSMHEVTSDRFVWKRPRIPTVGTPGHVTIKTEKTLSALEGGCTANDAEGPSGALNVRYLAVTTDTDTLVYEWDEGTQRLCKTSGTGRIASITSAWTVTPSHGADLCCMVRKVVRRIWAQDVADADGYTPTVHLDSMTDGELDGPCGSESVKVGSCTCHNTWSRTWGEDPFDTSTFGGLVDGYYLAASFVMTGVRYPGSGPLGPCGEVFVLPVCLTGCDPVSNMQEGPVTMVFGPDDSCRTSEPKMLFNRRCADCRCEPVLTPNKIEAPVNYTHLTDCCEHGAPPQVMCADTGEGFLDQNCTTIYAMLGCGCEPIPASLSTCEPEFPFPTCPIMREEWSTPKRTRADIAVHCACNGGDLWMEE